MSTGGSIMRPVVNTESVSASHGGPCVMRIKHTSSPALTEKEQPPSTYDRTNSNSADSQCNFSQPNILAAKPGPTAMLYTFAR